MFGFLSQYTSPFKLMSMGIMGMNQVDGMQQLVGLGA